MLMELCVKVVRVLVTCLEPEKMELHSRVEAGGEILAQSAVFSDGATRTELPTFLFQLSQSHSTVSLLFTLFDLSAASSSSSAEIGHCRATLPLQASSPSGQAFLEKPHLGLLGEKLAGTGVLKFTGKIWFQVQPCLPTLEMKTTHPCNAQVLLAREAAQSMSSSFPCDSGMVSVLFHTVGSGLNRLTPIACIGSHAGLIDSIPPACDVIVQHPIPTSILKPVFLPCSASKGLEMYLIDGQDKVFSRILSLASLRPFEVNHGQHTFCPNASDSTAKLSATVSLHYTPSKDEFSHYKGLEVIVLPPVNSSFSGLSKNIVVCAWLIDENDKRTDPVAHMSKSHPPFLQQRAKYTQSEPSTCKVSILRYSSSHQSDAPSDSERNMPAYFFYQAKPLLDTLKHETGIVILLQVFFTAEQSSDGISKPWWETPWIASTRIEISGRVRQQLTKGENCDGIFWELQGTNIRQPSGLKLLDSLSGMLRWKPHDAPFLAVTNCSQVANLPRLDGICKAVKFSGVAREQVGSSHCEQSIREERDEPETAEVFLADYQRAMAGMASEILRLRQENDLLRSTSRYVFAQACHESRPAAELAALEELSKANLIQTYRKVERALVDETEQRTACEVKIRSLTNALTAKADTDSQLFKLQEVHAIQQRLVQRLQSKVEKYRKCSDLCRKQEWLITQLESLLANQAQGDRMESSALALLRRENGELRALVQAQRDSETDGVQSVLAEKDRALRLVEKQLLKVMEKCRELEKRMEDPHMEAQLSLVHTSKVFELEQKLLLAETRTSVLGTELHENARRWAVEKARYEIKLAELSH